MPFLSVEAAKTLRLDQRPDGKQILFKIVAIPGQLILHTCQNREEIFLGTTTAQLAKAFGSLAVDSSWLPPGVCRWGRKASGDWVVRWYPPARYTLQFGNPDHKDSCSLAVPLPGIIFIGIGKTYYIWAIQEPTFSPQALLYVVPLPNIYMEGKICYGSNSPPAVSSTNWASIEKAWELFITTPFIADLSAHKSQSHPDDVRDFLGELAQKNVSSYPLEDLVPYANALTVEHAIHALIGVK